MKRYILSVLFVAVLNVGLSSASINSAADVAYDIYRTCLSQLSTSCVKPKALAWASEVVQQDVIKITDDLSIIRTGNDEAISSDREQRSGTDRRIELFDKIDSFLATHSLRMEAPEFLKSSEARSMLPKTYLKGGLAEKLEIPLTEGNAVEGRGFVKKVMIPFLLGIKFKTTVLVPLALALIALKTWKAMTLGLLSLVLSGALVIFKLARPKVVNYEVVQYPHHHVEHHIDHHLDHHHDHHHDHHPHHVEHIHSHPPPGWEPHSGWAARQSTAQDIAYAGQIQQ